MTGPTAAPIAVAAATVTASAPNAWMSCQASRSPRSAFLISIATTRCAAGSTTKSATRPTVSAVEVLTTLWPSASLNLMRRPLRAAPGTR